MKQINDKLIFKWGSQWKVSCDANIGDFIHNKPVDNIGTNPMNFTIRHLSIPDFVFYVEELLRKCAQNETTK